MASINPPITLPVNKWLGALTCLINYVQTANVNTGAFNIELLNETQDINVPDGNGKVIVSADVPTVVNYSEVSSILKVTKPVVAEQYMQLQNFKMVPLSIAEQFFKLSFTSATDSALFVGYLRSLMDASKNINLYEDLVALMENWTPAPYNASNPIEGGKRGQQVGVIKIPTFETSGITDLAQLNTTATYNSNLIYKTIQNTVANLNSPTTLYNEQGMKEFVSKSDLKLFLNSNIETNLIIDTLATLLNSEKINTSTNKVSKILTIPSGMLSTDNQTNLVGWLGHRSKFQWGYFYSLATAFFDASNLTTNYWVHFAYYMATVDNFPMVKLVLDPKAPAKSQPLKVVFNPNKETEDKKNE